MNYEPQDYSELIGLDGFNEELIKNHLTLYEGYVKNVNALADRAKTLLDENQSDSPEYAEIKRRFGWEFGGMRLHEYYFENLSATKETLDPQSELAKQIKEDFGSFEAWQKDFRSTGLMRGIGWVILYFDLEAGRLFNVWIGEHNINHLPGAIPVVVMDVWEHAYMSQFGLKRGDYIDQFLKHISWAAANDRFAPEELA